MSRLEPRFEKWRRLNARIIDCRRCPRLVEYRRDVARTKRRQYMDWTYWGKPVPGFGDRNAQVLLIGLAPAAHGANRTGRMFTGDGSGDWLFSALHTFGFANQPSSRSTRDGLTLNNAFVTAAARCAPPKNRPSPEELKTCRPYLSEEYHLLNRIRVVITLGRIAFAAFVACREESGAEVLKPRPIFSHGRSIDLPEGVLWIISYHPSRQNTQTGRLTRPMWEDIFRKAQQFLSSPAHQRPGDT